MRARDRGGQRGHDQADRALDRRPRVGRGLDRAASRRRRAPAARVAVVGSGPVGPRRPRSSSNRAGHAVTVFERDETGGGLLRFGIPDFKIEKHVVERRVSRSSPRKASSSASASTCRDADDDSSGFDAVVLALGSRVPRDLPVPGRELDGVHFAMDYLVRRNRDVAGDAPTPTISAAGKHVIVDRRRRHGRRLRRERAPRGCGVGDADRAARRAAREALGRADAVAALAAEAAHLVRAEGRRRAELRDLDDRPLRRRAASSASTGCRTAARRRSSRSPGTEESQPAELVLLAMGFVGPEPQLLDGLGVERDARGNIATANMRRALPGVFAAGDARRGQSLIVWAIEEGRRCAAAVDAWSARTRRARSGGGSARLRHTGRGGAKRMIAGPGACGPSRRRPHAMPRRQPRRDSRLSRSTRAPRRRRATARRAWSAFRPTRA